MTTTPVTYSRDADGVGWIVFDDPAARANILNAATQHALADAITQAEQDDLNGLVVASGKDRIFIAGADVRALAELPDAAAAAAFSRAGQQLFQRLADFRVPVVCAIHGACAGGGFELALACHWRIASDARVTQIGLPETSLGTIPGWGGSVRLPRLIGVKPALDHILRGQLLGPAEALAAGLVHAVVPAAELNAQARQYALKRAAEGGPVRSIPAAAPANVFNDLRNSMAAKARRQPALLAAIDAVEQTVQLSVATGLEVEARIFGHITAGESCKNLIHAFLLRETARKRSLAGWFADAPEAPSSPIRRVGVVGAGVMGSGIAQWLALHGCEVVLRDLDPAVLTRADGIVRALTDEAVKRGKLTAGEANTALHRIATTTSWDGFESCDLVIEAIVENAAAKRRLFSEVAAVTRPDAVLASNTSALPIEEIAGHVANPARTLGIHFFNPVSRMPLVELILGGATSASAAAQALALVKALGKSPVICRSSPGFLVTRVLFFYLNEAVRRWEQGTPAATIDGALREFGWPMGPLRLVDEVGLDVTAFIASEMNQYFAPRFTPCTACERLSAAGLKGRKNGSSRGFYRYEGGVEVSNETEARSVTGTSGGPAESSQLELDLMRVMVDEARRCLDEGLVKSMEDVDFALLSGAGFPAFRGGLLRWAKSTGL